VAEEVWNYFNESGGFGTIHERQYLYPS